MSLIYYPGLNCHLACIINIADRLCVNYLDAFAMLWSETDFTDEDKYNIYVSKRVFTNLKSVGIEIEMLDCNEIKIEESMQQILKGELFFLGMDTFYIRWHMVFHNFHSPHYFFARKETADSILCYDPVYNVKDFQMNINEIFSSTFELYRIHKVDAIPLNIGVRQDAELVLQNHPDTIKKLSADILKCKTEGISSIMLLLKQINAMINNRYLFQHLFHDFALAPMGRPSGDSPIKGVNGTFTLTSGYHDSFFNKSYFLKWEAVRNGLYKASILRENKNTMNEVYSLFIHLMEEEIIMAEKIITIK